ncbi:MAG TPA: hypothetical protein P5077_04790 [bacterium]|nr:hypothetical protein [bacterium]
MGTTLSIAFCAWCLFEAFRDLKRSLLILLPGILFAPYMIFGSAYVRIELVMMPALLFILLLRRGNADIPLPRVIRPIILLWALTLCVTLVSSVTGTAVSPAWFNAYAYLKPAIIILLFANAGFRKEDLPPFLRLFAATAIPLGLFAATQTFGLKAATDLTMSAYISPGRIVVERLVDELGFILRAVSVFEHPSYAASYFLIAFATSVYLLFELRGTAGNDRRPLLPLLSLIMSFIGGVMTLSGTFVAGLAIILFLLFLRLQWKNKLLTLAVSGALGLVIIGYLMVLGEQEDYESIANNITYQVHRVVSMELFETRYAKNTGYLARTIYEIRENPVIGYGWSRKQGVFIGDSMYVVILYQSGLIGLTLFAWWALSTYRIGRRSRIGSEVFLLWLFVLLIAGVGIPSFFTPRLNDWVWALCGILASQETAPTGETA